MNPQEFYFIGSVVHAWVIVYMYTLRLCMSMYEYFGNLDVYVYYEAVHEYV